jgi:hypothetical protein
VLLGAVVVTVAVPAVNLVAANLGTTQGSDVHTPDQAMLQQWERLAKILDAVGERDPKAVEAIGLFLGGTLIKEEQDRTVLLQQRAASLLAAASLTVTIIIAMISLLLKDGAERLTRRDIDFLRLLGYAILLAFVAAFIWTWQGFTVRSDFATFNLDDLLTVLERPDANGHTLQVYVSLQGYQIYQINCQVNSTKGQALKMATANLFAGLFLFSVFSLYLLLRSTTHAAIERRTSHAGTEND